MCIYIKQSDDNKGNITLMETFLAYAWALLQLCMLRYRWIMAWLLPYIVMDVIKPPITSVQNVWRSNGLVSKLDHNKQRKIYTFITKTIVLLLKTLRQCLDAFHWYLEWTVLKMIQSSYFSAPFINKIRYLLNVFNFVECWQHTNKKIFQLYINIIFVIL